MILKCHIFVVKVFPLKAANKACVLLDLLRIVFLRPEICKGVDDDSKCEVEYDDDDNEEEEDVVEDPDHEEGVFARRLT